MVTCQQIVQSLLKSMHVSADNLIGGPRYNPAEMRIISAGIRPTCGMLRDLDPGHTMRCEREVTHASRQGRLIASVELCKVPCMELGALVQRARPWLTETAEARALAAW